MADPQLSTTKLVRLAPPVVGVITNASTTVTDCGPFDIQAQFADLVDGCNDYPEHIFLEIYEAVANQARFTDLVQRDDPVAYYLCNDLSGSAVIEDFTGSHDASVYEDAVAPGSGSLEYEQDPLVNEAYFTETTSKSLGFKGSSDPTRAGIDLPSSFQPTFTDGFTFEAWVYIDPASSTTGNETLFQVGGLGNSIHIYLSKNLVGGNVRFLVYDGVNDAFVAQPILDSIGYGEIAHIVCTWIAGDSVNLYINGELVGTSSATTVGTLGPYTDTTTLGYVRDDYALSIAPPSVGNAISGDLWFYGLLDSVAIYNEALTTPIVREHYQAGAADQFGYGYGYGDSFLNINERTVVLTKEPTDPVDQPGLYKNADGTIELYWNSETWVATGISPTETIRLSNGSEMNPLMAAGELTYYDGYADTFHFEVSVFHLAASDGYGTGAVVFDCGNHKYGAEDPIPYSLIYTDTSIVDAEFEIVGPAGVRYVPPTSLQSGTATYSWQPDQNGKYVIRARGISENQFSTRFGNEVTYIVDVPPPEIAFDIIDEFVVCLPVLGSIVAVTEENHTFAYDLSENCFGTKNVQYSLDDEEWSSTGYNTGLVPIERLTAGSHTLRLRALDESGQYSTEASLTFYVSLSTFVTIDDYPEDPLCRPNSTATISGSRDIHTEVIAIRGVVTDTLRFPSSTTWEADIDLLGNETQIIEIEVESIFGHTAKATQELFYKSRLPKITVSDLKPVTYISKAILRGTRDAYTKVQVSHNNGPWTDIVRSSRLTTWEYVIELVSGVNEIQVRAVDTICGLIGEAEEVGTTYADSTFVTGAFKINNGAPLTGTTDVLLTFESSTATRMKVSNFEDFREGFETDYAETLSWTLTDNPGLKRVYVRFLDDTALESITFSDDILLTASNQLTEVETPDHTAQALNAIDLLTGNPLGTIVVIRDKRNGIFSIEIYLTVQSALEGKNSVAIATTVDEGLQTLILSDTGTGLVEVEGTVTVTTVRGAEDVYLDRRKDVWDVKTGESIIPLEYRVTEDASYFYALYGLPYYESRFQGRVQQLLNVDVDQQQTTLAIDKVFNLLVFESAESSGYGYSYGYGYEKAFAQAIENVPTPLKEHFATFPLAGTRFWYPTLSEYAMVTEIEETDSAYIITIDKAITEFNAALAARVEFTRQERDFIDYRIDKATGIVEFINESTYATGNVQLEYEFARLNKGRPDGNWYQLCGLKFNDLVIITIPQTQNRITFAQLKQICTRFYNGDEGTAPQIVRFIINDSIVYEDRTSEVIEGPEGYGYSYGYTGYGYKLSPGRGDQVVNFCAENMLSNDVIVDKIQIEFRATTPCMYIGEILVNAETVPVNSNLQIVVNGEVKFTSVEPVSDQFDKYEIRYEKGEMDIWYNNRFIYNVDASAFDQTSITRFFGATARTTGDKVDARFQEVIDKKYYDTTPVQIDLIGRFVGIEPNLREEND